MAYMNKILIVEDELAISELMKMALEEQGYKCEVADDGEKGANLIEKNQYDLILLDIMLPKIDGYELLEYIKQISEIPTIFITAKSQTKDKIKGLKDGADDYITKPFETEELLARIEAVLRRYNKGTEIQKIDNIEINVVSRTVKKDGKEVLLTPKEFDLLQILIQNKNFALYKETLYEKVWGEELEFETRTLDLHIQRLRKKLDWKDKIKTIYKIGYMLEV
jgi:DNA-binding response OmpR family regulator